MCEWMQIQMCLQGADHRLGQQLDVNVESGRFEQANDGVNRYGVGKQPVDWHDVGEE